MINFTLLINGSEVDLNDKVSIALTKTYESLEDPTKIFTDFSKTVTIPMTARNNVIFENAFRPDQVVTTGGLDPRKKVPFILLNNQTIIMVGVAKVVDTASNSPKDHNYYIVLYSKMGEIFNELKQLTFHPTEDSKYTIANPLTYNCTINRNLVRNSFCQESHTIGLADKGDIDYIGFMPTYQGKYDDFQSDKQELLPGRVEWTDSPEDKDGNTLDEGVEVDEHYMSEYRSYYQQPFVYVDAIWQLLKQKIEQISDYKLELDPSWFNPQNPYYADLVVTMPSLYDNTESDAGEEPTEKFSQHVNNYASNTRTSSDLSNNHKQILTFSHASGAHYMQSGNRFYANGNPVHFKSQFEFTLFAAKPDPQLTDGYARLRDDNNLYIEIRAVDAYTNQHIPGAVSKFMFYSNETDHDSENYTKIDVGIVSRNTPMYVTSPDPSVVAEANGYAWGGWFTAEFDVAWPNPFYIIANQYSANNGDPFEFALGSWVPRWDWLWTDFFTVNSTVSGLYWYLRSYNTECTVTTLKRSNSPLTMNRIWSLEKTPFELMLDYCKMFRLVFDLDTDDKTVRVMSRDRYFKNSEIEDWTDKVDRTKEFKLKPINFDKKWLDFKLAEGKGGLYQRYHDLYGVNYGSYKVKTGYDFNNEAVEVFTEIPPSMIASKQQDSTKFNTRHPNSANFMGYTYKYLPNEYFPDNDNDGKNAGNSGQFFFRNGTYTPDGTISWSGADGSDNILISDDTDWQTTHNQYCWTMVGNSLTTCNKLPAISTWSRDGNYSIHFAKPKELYFNRSMVSFSNSSFIYDKFWKDYLDDRYSVQTKVLNTYMYLTADDWQRFKFNKFVMIDNVLYMVNKIKDFDLTTDRSTKVELVQVNDKSNYSDTGARFPYLYTIPDTARITNGSSASVEVYSSSAWSVSSSSPWLYAAKNGDRLEVYVYSIDQSLTSNGAVVISNSEGIQWTLTVVNTQNGQLTPSSNYLHFPYGGATRTVDVASSDTMPIVSSAPSWITAEFNTTSWSYRDLVPVSGLIDINDADFNAQKGSQLQLTVTASRNPSNEARYGYIVIANTSGSCVIRVAQNANGTIIPIVPGGGREIFGIEDSDIERLELAAGEASQVSLSSPNQVDFLTLAISNGLTDSTGSQIIGETSFHVQPEISAEHTEPENVGVDGGYITVTTVDGQNIRWPYNIGSVPSYDVHVYAEDGNGYVTVGGVDGNYLGDHHSGDSIIIAATANAGYSFAGWSDGVSTASRTVTVGTEPLTLYASFAKTVVNRSVSYSLTNVMSSNGAATVADGTRYTTVLTPLAGYQTATVRVSMGGNDITQSAYSNGTVIVQTVTGNISITASAEEISGEWDYVWSADDNAAPLNFKNFDTSTGDTSLCVADTGGSMTQFKGMKVWLHDADASEEWYLPGPTNIDTLEIDAVIAVDRPDGNNPLIEMAGYTGTDGIEIVFGADYMMKYNKGGVLVDTGIKMDPSNVGLQRFSAKISVDEGKESFKVGSMFAFDEGIQPTLSLANRNGIFNDNSGSTFILRELKLRWKLKTEGTAAYNVTVNGSTGGSVAVDGVPGDYSDTVNGGQTLSLKAVPDPNCQFDKWSDNDTSASRLITVNGDTALTAMFKPMPQYVIYYETSDGQTVTPDGTVEQAEGDYCTLVSNTYQDGQGMLVYDKPIWRIGGDFFTLKTTVTAVTLPDTLEIILGNLKPFYMNGLTSIDLKNVRELGYGAFNQCQIKSLYIPKTLTDLGGIAPFYGNNQLEMITVDPNNPVYDSRNDCNCIVETSRNAIIKGSINSTIGDTIRGIDYNAFTGLPLTKMKFGAMVEFIHSSAFANCNDLAELTFTSPNPPRYLVSGNPFENIAQNGVLHCPAGSAEAYDNMKNDLLPVGWTVEE